jgi:hypothetical protein
VVVSAARPTPVPVQPSDARADQVSPTTLSRFAGLCVLGFVALLIGDGASGPNPTAVGPSQAVAWVLQHQRAIAVHGFVAGLEDTLFALFTVLLLAVIGARGVLPIIAYIGVAVSMATGWVLAGMMYGLAELAQGGGADAGIQTLFVLGNSMLDADAIAVALALICLGVLLVRARALVPPGWYALVLGVLYLFDVPLTIAGVGVIDPILLGLALLWLLSMGITLLVRPIRSRAQPSLGV